MQPSVVGTLIRIENFFDVAGTPVDPVSIVFTLKRPGIETPIVYTYPADTQVVRDAVGVYHVDYLPTETGTHVFSWNASGNAEVTTVNYFEATSDNALTARIPQYMSSADLDARIGAAKVDQLFDDDGDMLRDANVVNTILIEAEDFAATYMLSAWPIGAVNKMASSDESFRAQVAWVALELASERRGEFLAEDGKGRYWMQMQRAQKYFDLISKGRLASAAESNVGASAQSGGRLNGAPPVPAPQFIWAADRNNRGQGGF